VAKTPQGLTIILSRAKAGDERARRELIALIYDELRQVASRLMRRERAGHTLSPTAVVHEAVSGCWATRSSTGRRTAATSAPLPRGRCGKCSSTTPGSGPPPAEVGACGASRSTR
jgi:ECF sigma factor